MNMVRRFIDHFAALLGRRIPAANIGPQSAGDPFKPKHRPPERRQYGARLVWDSNTLGPAYRIHDSNGRPMYIRLKEVPIKMRTSRRARRGHERWAATAAA